MVLSDENFGMRTKTARTICFHMDPDKYTPIKETRRTSDVRTPLTLEYDLPAVMEEVLGRESATCEACQQTVHHPTGGDLEGGEPFVIRDIVDNVYNVANRVLLCHSCANRPTDEWKADVCAKRVRERERSPSWRDYVAYWLSDPTATSLFARRIAGCLTGLVVLVATLAGIVGALSATVATGWAWARTVAMATSTVISTIATHPWIVGSFVGIAYISHAVERVRYDPRGYCSRGHRPWALLILAGVTAGIGAFGLLFLAIGLLPATRLVQLVVAVVWLTGAASVAWYIDLAIRHDLAIGIWRPNRGLWIIAGRVGLLPGLVAIVAGVPFPSVLAPTTTGILAAIPAGVAFAFTGLRLPYDSRARDAVLDVIPEWILTALSDERRRD
ncbi:hypothetical protein SAMN04487948_12431 [Halogranum amylolyticum]|uniref:Uncharacterized protein n=1 Tax=Halogranum amylolyticum TaxID=660520 RepID=A0A1H8W693_9EURY|nr:hypothetical protein SAMN04487948_12431 [Halogranum amylolyticum]